MDVGRVLFPALRWRRDSGFGHETGRIDEALGLGVGGFIVFGGDATAVRDLTAELRTRSRHPLLIGADLERGAGQQFAGATALPPAAAFGELDDLDATRRAGELTAREAAALGVNWVYAPVADLDIEPDNPIVGSRAFGDDAARVAAHVRAWVEGCRVGGALSCAKHFPGHGRTLGDSHLELPSVDASRGELTTDLEPFCAAFAAGVDSVMTAHVAYPALDPEAPPATLSRPILTGLLRGELGYRGLVVTDALIMEGFREAGDDEPRAAIRALHAGCDALLYPADPAAVAAALRDAAGSLLPAERVAAAIDRVATAAARVDTATGASFGRDEDRAWARDQALRSLRVMRGDPAVRGPGVELFTIDDDVGGPFPAPPRDAFAAALAAHGVEVVEGTSSDAAGGSGEAVVALYCDIRGWKGRAGVSSEARRRLDEILGRRPDAVLAFFGHPRLATDLPAAHVLAAWSGEPLLQQVTADRLASG